MPMKWRALWILLFAGVSQAFHHRLTKRELHHVFGVDAYHKVPEYHLIRTIKNLNGENLRLEFEAWNETYQAELTPNRKLVSPHLISVIRDGENATRLEKLNLDYSCHYQGKLTSHKDAPIAISDCRTLMGTLVLDEHFLVLQTIPQRLHHEQEEKHLVFKREASLLTSLERTIEEELVKVNEVAGDFCDTTDLFALNYTVPPAGQLDSPFIFPQLDPITLEIGLFLDSKLYEHFKREYIQDAEQHLLDFSLALINNVYVLYQQPTLSPNLDIVIVRYELWKTQPSNLHTSLHKNGQAQSLLDAFCRHQSSINPGTDLTDNGHWDHGVLLTGYDIYHTTTSVAGVAPVARMCDPLFACSLVEGLHLGRSFVLAHEMGHNMGMVHDGVQNQCSRSCCLMSAVNGAGKTQWSECSVREFNAFLLQLDESGRGNCLRDSNSGVQTHNHLADGRLPGQRFTGDQQCGYFWGRDYVVEIPNGRSMDDICRILWCGNSGSTISTAHPALEGSWCGNDRWCIEGRCRGWPYGPKPVPVHGGWSDWSTTDTRCPVQQCHIAGSISIKGQHRDCVNPAPNNGGRGCQGSSIRGLICGASHSNCRGLERQEFGDRVCSSIKNDPLKPDRQLTGESFMHDTQPCKVWCHLIDSELIRNKGTFPDGSPCGSNMYCISGACLTLDCNNKAVVENGNDCPDGGFGSTWGQWSDWSECSKTCGINGRQNRLRSCEGRRCSGASEESRPCEPQLPPCEEVGPWSPWSPCDKKCDEGRQIRSRDCLAVECTKALTETRACNNGACYTDWSSWSECSSTCGGGERQRKRVCAIPGACNKAMEEREKCNEQKCQVESWGDWLPCSVSCGVGFQIRERLCDGILCQGGNKQARTCNEQPCTSSDNLPFHLSEWNDWSSCSETCGVGVQLRLRSCVSGSCPVSARLSERKRCVMGPCPNWSDWGQWSDCPSCDSSLIQTRTRSCSRSLTSETQCRGSSIEQQTCDKSCKGPRIITAGVKNKIEKLLEDEDWGNWQPWSSCSASCGGGSKRRSRLCKSSNCKSPIDYQQENCNEQDCDALQELLWSHWSEWTECSAECGEGKRRRSRRCRSIFSFACSAENKEQTEPCYSPCKRSPKLKTPEWSEWSSWSGCSCFTETESRRRYCRISDPAVQGFCSGKILEQRKCSPRTCAATNGGWSDWSPWSECSRDCDGTGHQIRNRMCSNPLPVNKGSYCAGYSFDQRSCSSNKKCEEKIDGGWSEWTGWSECSDPCNNGHRSRTRYCISPRPSGGGLQCFGQDFELEQCSDPTKCHSSQPGWSPWSDWSECPLRGCGFFVQERGRVCRGAHGNETCHGLAHMTSPCPIDPCPQSIDGSWSEWSSWSRCTSNCGIGLKTRSRECYQPQDGGAPCFGRSAEVAKCVDDFDVCTATLAHLRQIDRIHKSSTL
ncbi:unnamed protein product, partial [Mesorhabditis belari]|uniref:Peptidase M12B domain-containing protein n=1 Tax=Mesorhabditis belari TaxID=2138241 RepID=A0AAF3FL20_9BILA